MMKFVKYDIKKIEILLMLLFVAFQSRAYDFEKDGIYYNFNGTIPFEVFVTYRDNPFDVGYQPSYSGVVVIPETVEFANKYYRITEIGDFAFRGCSSLSSSLLFSSSSSSSSPSSSGSNERVRACAFRAALSICCFCFRFSSLFHTSQPNRFHNSSF